VSGFADLRLNNRQQSDESFWPSFTDIMTVIVMIFMLAMLTLLLRNMDLVSQLRSALDAERSASAQAQSATDINARLRMRLQQLEDEAAMIRMRLMDLGEEHQRSLSELAQSRSELSELNSRFAALMSERQLLAGEKEALSAQLAMRDQELAENKQLLAASREQLSSLQAERDSVQERVALLEGEFNDLRIKYNKLIRPARSSVGKFVVQVRFNKSADTVLREIKRPGDATFAAVSEARLHAMLREIRKRQGDKLYVKVIIPDENNLSYTEAWNLTESVLRAYDYYYRDEQ